MTHLYLGQSAPVRLMPLVAPRSQTSGNLQCRIVPSATSQTVLQEFEVGRSNVRQQP